MKAPDLTAAEVRVAVGPYQGLTFFTEDDADFFFGRDHWRDVIVANLQARRLTVLYGPSGVGKSSLLRAGVITRLDDLAQPRGALRFVPVYFSAWQGDPSAELSKAIRERTLAFAEKEVKESGALSSVIEAATTKTGVPLLIVLDQFEDYWTYQGPRPRNPVGSVTGDDADASFAAHLAKALASELPVNFLISLREDSLAQLDRTFKRRVSRLLDHRLSLTPLNREEGELAIRGPLRSYSEVINADPPLDVEDSLVDVVLDQVQVGKVSAGKGSTAAQRRSEDDSDAIEAPYLQLVMRRIWESERDEGSHVLRAATLARFGGAEEIVTTHVGSSLSGVGPDAQDAIAELLRYLVSPSHTKLAWTVDDLARFTRRPEEEVRALLAILADPTRRIVRPVGTGAVRRYEIFHDVLAEPLLDWASAREITRAEREKAKRLEAEQREAQERRAKVRAQWAVRALLLAVFATLAVIAVIFIRQALQEHETAQSEQLAARAVQSADLGLASLYALESYRISHTEDARSAILQVAGSHEIGMPFAASDGGINQVAWSRDRTTLATAGGNGWVRLWDVQTHRPLAQLPPPNASDALRGTPHLGIVGPSIGAIAFSPDGHRLVYGQNIEYFSSPKGDRTVQGTVHVWDVQARKPLFVLGGEVSHINALAFSRDGRQLAVADGELSTPKGDNKIWLWNLGHRRTEKALAGGGGPVNSVAFSPDGKTLASSSCDYGDHDNHSDTGDHSVLLWDTGSGRNLGRLRGRSPICSVAFSPDSKMLAAAGDDHSVTLWDVRHRQPLEPPFVGHTDVLNGVAYSPDGRTLATAGRDHTVRLWDVASHRQLGSPLTVVGGVNSVAFNPAGTTLASGGADGARVWSVAGPYELRALPSTHRSPVYSVAFSPDGRLLAWSDGYAHKSRGRKVIGGTVYVWDAQAHRMLDVIPAPTDNVNSLAFGPGGRTLAWAANDLSVWLWSVWKHSRLQRIPAPAPNGGTMIERVAISPDGNTVAFADMEGERATIGLWNVQRRHLVMRPLGKVGSIIGLAFSRHTHLLASAGSDGKVRLWDLTRDRQVAPLESRTFAGSTTSQYDVAFSPDGKTLASAGGDGAIVFWDVASHRELGAPLTQHTAAAYSVGFSGDGKTLASASLDRTVRLWDVGTERALLTLAGHTSYVFGVAFSRDLGIIASAGDDGTVRLWGNTSLQSGIARLCTYINPRTAQRIWLRIEPSIAYRPPCS